MSILDFVNQDELDDLDEDPRIEFMQLVNIAQRSLAAQILVLDPENQHEWQKAEELRYGFMNVVVASAKRFEIEPSTLCGFRNIRIFGTGTIGNSSLTWTTMSHSLYPYRRLSSCSCNGRG